MAVPPAAQLCHGIWSRAPGESRPITSNPRVHSEPRGFPRQKCQLLGHSSTVTARHTPSADESAPRVSVNTSSPHQGSSKASRRWRLVTATPPAQTSLVPPALGIVICFCPACLPKMPPARGQHHGSAQKPPLLTLLDTVEPHVRKQLLWVDALHHPNRATHQTAHRSSQD